MVIHEAVVRAAHGLRRRSTELGGGAHVHSDFLSATDRAADAAIRHDSAWTLPSVMRAVTPQQPLCVPVARIAKQPAAGVRKGDSPELDRSPSHGATLVPPPTPRLPR